MIHTNDVPVNSNAEVTQFADGTLQKRNAPNDIIQLQHAKSTSRRLGFTWTAPQNIRSEDRRGTYQQHQNSKHRLANRNQRPSSFTCKIDKIPQRSTVVPTGGVQCRKNHRDGRGDALVKGPFVYGLRAPNLSFLPNPLTNFFQNGFWSGALRSFVAALVMCEKYLVVHRKIEQYLFNVVKDL